MVTVAASLLAGLVAYVADRLLHFGALTAHGGGAGSLLRLLLLTLIMVPIIAWMMLAARVPEAYAALAAVQRRLGRRARPTPEGRETVAIPPTTPPDGPRRGHPLTYADQRNSHPSRNRQFPAAARRGPPASVAGDWMREGPAGTDDQPAGATPDHWHRALVGVPARHNGQYP